eukprot:TRINITY_DN6479_c0_g3_i1.p1 TRINITY_DN6479_c0_g3~~TRINITY_DN6479_c0_g3_i1.p1  ORF type:complete len:651 (-),score=81.74 TRINITY_DN6479_c0_g3_i1:50-1891(-)
MCKQPMFSRAGNYSIQIVSPDVSITKKQANWKPFSPDVLTISILDCSASSCAECALKDSRCVWCLYDNKCDTSFACTMRGSISIIDSLNNCPALLYVTPSEVVIPSTEPVVITGTYFIDAQYQCSFGTNIVDATYLNSTNIQCETPPVNSSTSVSIAVFLNGFNYASNQLSLLFSSEIEQSDSDDVSLPLVIILPVAFVILIVIIILAIIYKRRRISPLTEPDYSIVAFAYNDRLMFHVSDSQAERLKLVEDALDNDNDRNLVFALADVSSAGDSEFLAKALVYYYYDKGSNHALQLIKAFIDLEVSHSVEEGTLFRSESIACKMFSIYAKLIGLPYLWHSFSRIIFDLNTVGDQEGGINTSTKNEGAAYELAKLGMEVDPGRMEEMLSEDSSDLTINQYSLQLYAQKLFNAIKESLPNLPMEFRELSSHLRDVIGEKFGSKNKADFKGVGGFIFLRYICPAIMTPQVYALLPEPPNTVAQRYFVLLSKALQNLANFTLPGSKEDYMEKINPFILENEAAFLKFLDELVNAGSETSSGIISTLQVPRDLRISCVAFIHKYIVDKKGKLDSKVDDEELLNLIDRIVKNVGEPCAKVDTGERVSTRNTLKSKVVS